MLPRIIRAAMWSGLPLIATPNSSQPAARIMAACANDTTRADSTLEMKNTRTLRGVARMRIRMRFSRCEAIVVASPIMEKFITPHTASAGIRKSR